MTHASNHGNTEVLKNFGVLEISQNKAYPESGSSLVMGRREMYEATPIKESASLLCTLVVRSDCLVQSLTLIEEKQAEETRNTIILKET